MSVSIDRETILKCGATKLGQIELDVTLTDLVIPFVPIDNARLV